MIRFDDICDRIIQINNSVKREKNMNKNTLINNVNSKDYSKVNMQIEDEIMDVCSADNLCSFSQFETDELMCLEKNYSNFAQDGNVMIDDFLSKDLIAKLKIKINEIIKNLKAIDFKKCYFQNLKKQKLLNNDLSESIKCGKQLIKLTSEEQGLKSEYDKCLKDSKVLQESNMKKYTQMIKDFCIQKKLPDSISDIAKTYSNEVLQTFLARKIVYLIFKNYDKDNIAEIAKVIEQSERFKNTFASIYQRVLELLKCGNK